MSGTFGDMLGDISRTAWKCLNCKCYRVTVTDNSKTGRPQIVESMLKRCPLFYRDMDYIKRMIPDDDPEKDPEHLDPKRDPERGDHGE